MHAASVKRSSDLALWLCPFEHRSSASARTKARLHRHAGNERIAIAVASGGPSPMQRAIVATTGEQTASYVKRSDLNSTAEYEADARPRLCGSVAHSRFLARQAQCGTSVRPRCPSLLYGKVHDRVHAFHRCQTRSVNRHACSSTRARPCIFACEDAAQLLTKDDALLRVQQLHAPSLDVCHMNGHDRVGVFSRTSYPEVRHDKHSVDMRLHPCMSRSLYTRQTGCGRVWLSQPQNAADVAQTSTRAIAKSGEATVLTR